MLVGVMSVPVFQYMLLTLLMPVAMRKSLKSFHLSSVFPFVRSSHG